MPTDLSQQSVPLGSQQMRIETGQRGFVVGLREV